jgi:hypothetical protein
MASLSTVQAVCSETAPDLSSINFELAPSLAPADTAFIDQRNYART